MMGRHQTGGTTFGILLQKTWGQGGLIQHFRAFYTRTHSRTHTHTHEQKGFDCIEHSSYPGTTSFGLDDLASHGIPLHFRFHFFFRVFVLFFSTPIFSNIFLLQSRDIILRVDVKRFETVRQF